MKKYLILALSSLLSLSCSEDDSAPVDNSTPTYLLKLKQTIYQDGIVEEKIEFDYIDGRLDKAYFYTSGNQLMAYTHQNYNNSGLISSTITYSPTGAELNSNIFTYDSMGRLINSAREEGEYTQEIDYTHNSDNTITATTSYGGSNVPSIKTFFLNSNGLVYKEVATNTYELTFDGFNPISASSSTGFSKTFEYDEVHPYEPIVANTLDPYKPNSVLRGNSLANAETSTATKYLIKETSNSEVRESVITFDNNGRPSHQSSYRNDILIIELEYVYE